MTILFCKNLSAKLLNNLSRVVIIKSRDRGIAAANTV